MGISRSPILRYRRHLSLSVGRFFFPRETITQASTTHTGRRWLRERHGRDFLCCTNSCRRYRHQSLTLTTPRPPGTLAKETATYSFPTKVLGFYICYTGTQKTDLVKILLSLYELLPPLCLLSLSLRWLDLRPLRASSIFARSASCCVSVVTADAASSSSSTLLLLLFVL